MQYRPLGSCGYTVSRLCFGALTLGPLAADLPLEDGAALLRAALEAGVNFFDTAQYYRTYDYMAQALTGWQGEVIIASKSYAESAEEMAYAVEEARIALRRDKIDIFLLHEQRDAAALEANRPALEYLLQAKTLGIVGAVGISTHDVSAARLAAVMPEIDIIHAMFNLSGLGIRGGGLQDMRAALRLARANGKGVYTMKALGGGALIKEAKDAVTWAFAQEEADAVALGMKDTAELKTNIAWMEGREAVEAGQVRLLDRNLVFDKTPSCARCAACLKRCPQQALSLGDDGIMWAKGRCLFCGYCIAACPWFCISFC
jgi:aryl-alcohol dehydrogenase-like predicted oxidoreductase